MPTAALAALLIAGCAPRPLLEGPQLRDSPAGFVFAGAVEGGRPVLEGRDVVSHVGYARPGGDEHCFIDLLTYAGSVDEAAVRRRVAAMARRHPAAQYGPLGPVTIGRRPGWTWTETQRWTRGDRAGRTAVMVVNVVLPWDDRTYALRFIARDPAWMDEARMRAVLGRFVVAEKGRIRS